MNRWHKLLLIGALVAPPLGIFFSSRSPFALSQELVFAIAAIIVIVAGYASWRVTMGQHRAETSPPN
jgi:hypothetical protein